MAIFQGFAQAAGPAVVATLWQGSVLAAGLTICLRVAHRVPAADRFRAWAVGFAALVALPFLPLLQAFHGSAAGAQAEGLAARAWLELDPKWTLAIAGLWMAASGWRAADLAVHGLQLRKVWKRAEVIDRAAAGVEICATRELDRPSVIGFLRPRILIPEWLLRRLTAAELEQVIGHEAEHLRRHDDWTNLLQKLALVVFPLNPALAWMERQLCHEREMACDDAVVRATGQPRAYAACLASLAEHGLQRRREALSLGAWRRRPELVGRVHRLLKHGPGLQPAAARTLLAVVGCGVAFGAMELARAPQLVAFVARPVAIAESSTPDMVNIDPHTRELAMAGYTAVNAVAHVLAGRTLSSAEKSGQNETRGHRRSMKDAFGASVSGYVTPATVEDAGRGAGNGQWIVLTAWEQVVTMRRDLVADYDVDQAAPAQSTGQPAIAEQWTITHLVLRVDPAQMGAAEGGRSADSNSQPAQPAAIPLHDGWLVLQL